MLTALDQYFRCADLSLDGVTTGVLSVDPGFFRFGPNTICYGRSAAGFLSQRADQPLYDVFDDTSIDGSTVHLPFDLGEIVENLRAERYISLSEPSRKSSGGDPVPWAQRQALRPKPT